jgi:pullulanase
MKLNIRFALRAMTAFAIALSVGVIAACGGGSEDATLGRSTAQGVKPTPVSADQICNATSLSTVLVPVPSGGGGGVTPVNVKVHYNRPDGIYTDWGLHLWQVNGSQYVADYPGVSWSQPLLATGVDSYGAYFIVEASKFTNPNATGFGFIVHKANQNGDPGVDRIWQFSEGTEFWLKSGDATVYKTNPLGGTPDITTVRVHYKRFDANYSVWGLHLWDTSRIDVSRLPGLTLNDWNNPIPLSSMPNYTAAADGSEVAFDLPVLNPTGDPSRTAVEFIIHGLPSNPNGGVNNKDGWNDNIRVVYTSLSITSQVGEIWLVQEEPTVFTSVPDLRTASTKDARAVWLTKSILKWPRVDTAGSFRLYHSATGRIIARRGVQ